MKKLLLSFLCCMLAIIGMQAAEVELSKDDATGKGTSGSGSSFTIEKSPITFEFDKAYGASESIRSYANSNIIISGATETIITQIVLTTTGGKNGTWSDNVVSSSTTHTWTGNANSVTLTTTAQARITSIVVTYEGGGEFIDIVEPTFSHESGTEFEESLNVTITVEEGLQAFYSIGNEDNFINGTTFTVTETTTVYAYAQDAEGNKSNVVSAKYTKSEPLPANTIVFNNEDGNNDSSSAATIDNFIDNLIKNTNIEGLTCTATSKCYKGKAGYGIKMGTSSLNGSFTLQLASAMNVESIVVNAESWGSDEAQLSVNGSEAQPLTAEFANYTFEINKEINEITVNMTKRGYIKSLTINVANGETPGDDPVVEQLAAPTFSPAGGAVEAGTEVTITAPEGATLVYTVNDGELSEEGVNTATVVINEETTIEAYATQVGFTDSEVVTATYTIKPSVEPEEGYAWNLVIDDSTLAVGDKVVIVATESDKALSTTQNSNNRGAQSITKDASEITIDENVQVLTLEQGTVEGSWAFYTGDGYLYAASGSSNHLKTQATKDDNGSWNVTIADGVASIVAQGENTRNELKYNSQSNLFSCYGENNTQKNVSLYRKEVIENITSGNCYNLAVGAAWAEPEGCWYAAKFINANTGEYTWSVASDRDDENIGYIFYLAPGNTPLGHKPQLDPDFKYTHVEFVQLPATVEEPADIRTLDLTGVEYTTTGVIWYDGVSSKTYSIAEKAWMAVGTGVNRVELADGIGYAYGVVSAEGAIEVYNVNGAVVARGNDNVDLRGLGRGVYIIRNGNQVRKVVR